MRSIVIPYDATPDQVDRIFPNINGVLFPGGAASVPPAAHRLWQLAEQSNANGVYFPIWGTCLGFEFLLMLGADRDHDLMEDFAAENVSLPLYFSYDEKDGENGKGSHHSPSSLLYDEGWQALLPHANITMNNHQFGLTPESFNKNDKLTRIFDATTISYDLDGKAFVSTIEPKDPDHHPYYGVQYHPEKAVFEYGTCPHTNLPLEATDHSVSAIRLALHLAEFFGNAVRKNQRDTNHTFREVDDYPFVYTYPRTTGVKFEEIYVIGWQDSTPPEWLTSTEMASSLRGSTG